ncbi:MAG: nucleotide sugar dehydrogenase [Candidatus Parcubacteria bacterium]|nr:nucleotide sugar dehydrogenase [Burkholderiales bacterium]
MTAGGGAAVVAVVGLGYVGLPLAVEFGRKLRTIGFDRSRDRIDELKRGEDRNRELGAGDLRSATALTVTAEAEAIKEADFVIVAVPTPVNEAKRPDMSMLVSASRSVGSNLKRGATVIYESTVYPGATAGICVPELEKASGLTWKKDFHVGYSPERINPGDREHALAKIVKVVSGDSPQTLDRVAALYGEIVAAGVHRAPSIEIAEAAKVIENTQRDLNIALMNELAMVFDRLGLDTGEVLRAAGTKWNFLPFSPGLVGGHCIGVDPYYLTHCAEMAGYHPQVILAGRRINDGMPEFVAAKAASLLEGTGIAVRGATINLLGLAFKENVTDLRNSKVADLRNALIARGAKVLVHDPLVDPAEAEREYGVVLQKWETLPRADALILAVAHREYRQRSAPEWLEKLVPGGCVIDIKGALDLEPLRSAGSTCWRL